MIPILMLVALAGAPSFSSAMTCDRYVVDPGPEQGMADAALVRRASGHDVSPRSLGTTLASGEWRVVWAHPDYSEPGIFFFRGPRDYERLVDIWGGPTSDEAGAYHWALKIGAPRELARCFAQRLVHSGL